MRVEIDLLGRFEVRVEGVPVPAGEWRRRQAAALVKLLALAPRRTLHREQVIDSLWPGLTVEDAAARLHKAAHYARRSLGVPQALVLSGDHVQLCPDVAVIVDAEAFQRCAERALAAEPKEWPAETSVADRWTGGLLPDDPYEPWLEEPRERLEQLHQALLRRAGRWAELARADPADEEAGLALARQLADAGDRRGALRQLERLERAVRRELGMSSCPGAATLRAALLGSDTQRPEHPLRPPPVLGRDAELGRLDRLIAATGMGRGRTVFICGAAGIGKTTLLRWLDRRAVDRGLRVGRGRAAGIEGAWPYAPVLEAVADLCRRHPAMLDGLPDDFRVEIEGALQGTSPEWIGESRHQRLFVSVAELLRLAATGEGAVLIVDDLHDADEASLRLLHYLARIAVEEPITIVVAHRPWPLRPAMDAMRRSLIGRGPSVVQLDLGPMSEADIRRLAARTLGSDERSLDRVTKLAGGSPFAAVELARIFASGDDGPARMGAFVLHGLGDAAVGALTRVAVLGSKFDTDEYTALSGLDEDQAYACLDECMAADAVERTGDGYRFRHALVRDALLDPVPPHHRLRLHRQAADALRRLGASPARIGQQLLRASDVAAAAPFILQAARTDAAIGAYSDALALLEAIRADVPDAERGPLLALRADMLMATGDAAAVLAYREALGAAADDTERRRLRPRLARAATFAGDYATAAEALDGLEPDGSADDAALLLQRGLLAYQTGDLSAAEAAGDEARRRLDLSYPSDWRMYDLITLQGLCAHRRGEWFTRLGLELRAGAERPDLALSIFDSYLCVAEYLLYGPTPYAEVMALATTLRESAQRSGVLRAVAFATALRGEAALLSGDLPLAEVELTRAVELHHEIGSNAGEALSLQRLAEVRLAHGRHAEAMELLHRALPLARWSAIGLHLLHRVYGTMIRAAEDVDSARAVVDRATATLGQEDNCTFCNVMLAVPAAVACADAGDLDDARRHLAIAEQSVVLWRGTAWQAAIAEARAHLHQAEGDAEGARQRMLEAAELFAAAGQPLDVNRCHT
ncbi:MAG TPA: AAA family ATPase [Microlunatus sp.]